jgi:type VI secretion system protein ImpH
MATPSRRAEPPVERELFAEPYRYDFFQAVRLLERIMSDRAAVGRDARREVVRFNAHVSLAFPPSALQGLDRPSDPDLPPVLACAFMGMAGPVGVLPTVYTELVLQRLRAGDKTPAAFLDIFNHRMISLFYRAWEKYRPALAHERRQGDRFADYLMALIGLYGEPLRHRHAFPDAALPYRSGAFAQRHRPAVMLGRLLGEYFREPMEVIQFIGQWLRLAPADRSILGSGGPYNELAVSFVLGDRSWDEPGKFRLRVGPLGFKTFRRFLPDGAAFLPLVQMTRLHADGEFDFDVQLVLKAEEVPDCQLNSRPGKGPRLGRFAWLKSMPFEKDADDAVFASGV